jgi:hypothetical protein
MDQSWPMCWNYWPWQTCPRKKAKFLVWPLCAFCMSDLYMLARENLVIAPRVGKMKTMR